MYFFGHGVVFIFVEYLFCNNFIAFILLSPMDNKQLLIPFLSHKNLIPFWLHFRFCIRWCPFSTLNCFCNIGDIEFPIKWSNRLSLFCYIKFCIAIALYFTFSFHPFSRPSSCHLSCLYLYLSYPCLCLCPSCPCPCLCPFSCPYPFLLPLLALHPVNFMKIEWGY